MNKYKLGDMVAYKAQDAGSGIDESPTWRASTIRAVLDNGKLKTKDGLFWRGDGTWLRQAGIFNSVSRLHNLSCVSSYKLRAVIIKELLGSADWAKLTNDQLELIGRFLLLNTEGCSESLLERLRALFADLPGKEA